MAVSEATIVAVTPSIPHRNAPSARLTIPRTVGMPMASSAVTVPRSLDHNGQCAANESREQPLDTAALENDGQKSGESSGGDRCDGVFRGNCAAFTLMTGELVHVDMVLRVGAPH
jgi:hypothetical protein